VTVTEYQPWSYAIGRAAECIEIKRATVSVSFIEVYVVIVIIV